MGIDYTFKDVVNSFNTVREDIIDFTSRVFTILLGPLLIYGIYFERNLFSIMTIVNTLVIISLLLLILQKLKLGINVKKVLLLFILLYCNLFSIYNLGFFGGSQYFMILIFGLTTFYFRKWFALCINISVVVYFFIFMQLYTGEQIDYSSPPAVMVTSKVIWLADFLLSLIIITIGGYAIYKTFKSYSQIVREHVDSLKKFNYTLDNLPIPVAALKENKQIPYFNEMFYKYFGYESEEIPSFNHWLKCAYPDQKHRTKVGESTEEIMKKAFKLQKQLPIEYHDFKTKNGEIKSAEVHHTFLGDTAICAFVDLTERKQKRRLIIETMMQAEEKENQRIAQELHDGVGPLLSTAKIYAHSMMVDCNCSDKTLYGNKLKELLDSSIKELRNTINNVSPQILQQYGLVSAIDSFVKHIEAVTSIKFKFAAKPLNINSPLIELTIYRAILELINNSVKYGKPSQININLDNINDTLCVKYKDNGCGFDFEKKKRTGFGLSNIINRIETVGGEFDLISSLGEGVDVNICFDL